MFLRLFLCDNDLLKMLIGLFEHSLKAMLVLALKGDRIGHLQLACADDAASDWNTFLRGVMLNVEWAFVCMTTTVMLVPATRVLVALFTEVCVGTAPECCQVAAKVAFELNVADTVLLAHKLLAHTHVVQSAALAHKLLLIHFLLLSLSGLLSKLLVHAVDIASEEWAVASLALIKFANMQSVLKRLLIKAISWIIKSLVVVQHIVLLEFFKSILAKSALEDAHLCDLLSDFRNGVRTL